METLTEHTGLEFSTWGPSPDLPLKQRCDLVITVGEQAVQDVFYDNGADVSRHLMALSAPDSVATIAEALNTAEHVDATMGLLRSLAHCPATSSRTAGTDSPSGKLVTLLSRPAVSQSVREIIADDPMRSEQMVDILFKSCRDYPFDNNELAGLMGQHLLDAYTRAYTTMPAKRIIWQNSAWQNANGANHKKLITETRKLATVLLSPMSNGVDKDKLALQLQAEASSSDPIKKQATRELLFDITGDEIAAREIIPRMYGLDPDEIRLAQDQSYGPHTRPDKSTTPGVQSVSDYQLKSMERLARVGERHPGAWQRLRANHFIRTPGRYPEEMLELTLGSLGKRYDQSMTVVVAQGSRNPALLDIMKLLLPVQRELLAHNIAFWIMEVASRDEMAHGVDAFEARGWGQASIGALVCHGLPNSFDLSHRQSNAESTVHDFDVPKFLAPLVSRMVRPGGQFAGLACSWMAPLGIGERLKYHTKGIEVIGSKRPAAITGVKLDLSGNMPRIVPSYVQQTPNYTTNEWEHTKVEPRIL